MYCDICIGTWILFKDNHCPLCREEINEEKMQKTLDVETDRWSVIDKNDLDYEEYCSQLDDIFVEAFKRLITN